MRTFVRAAFGAALTLGSSHGAQAQSAPPGDWSGFYAGGLVGVNWSRSDVQTVTGRLQYFDATDARQIARVGDNRLDEANPGVGLVAGYGKQFGNVLVGMELSAQSLSLDKSYETRQEMDANPGSQSVIRQSVSADWMAGLRLRLGWAERNWLAYVTAGVATTRLKLDARYSDNAFSGLSQASRSASVMGWSLGLGAEYALNANWSLRGECLYTRFGHLDMVSDVTSTNNSGGTLMHEADLETYGLALGLNYRFR